MNVFQMSGIGCLLLGAVAGGRSVKAAETSSYFYSIFLGLLTGGILWSVSILLSCFAICLIEGQIAKEGGEPKPLSWFQWGLSLFAVLVLGGAVLLTPIVTEFVVTGVWGCE